MIKLSAFESKAAFIVVASLLAACSGASSQPSKLASPLDIESGPPEDICADGATAYVSSLADASITKLDLVSGMATQFVGPANGVYSSGWGLRIVKARGWLLNVQNQPYDFNPQHARAGRLTAFDLQSGDAIESWELPDKAVGNSVDVDTQGNIYVGDIGPNTRILRVDPNSDEVTVWATSDDWVNGGFGIGGMVSLGRALYAAHDNKLWYVAIQEDGSAAAPKPVKIEGDPVIFADGMAFVDGSIVYAENDVLVAGPRGAVYRIDFTTSTTAVRTTLRERLRDPSGVTSTTVDGKPYLLVNESQLGFIVGVDEGTPKLPYEVVVIGSEG